MGFNFDFIGVSVRNLQGELDDTNRVSDISSKLARMSISERDRMVKDAITVIKLSDCEVEAIQSLMDSYRDKYADIMSKLSRAQDSLEVILRYDGMLYQSALGLKRRIEVAGHAIKNCCLNGLGREIDPEWQEVTEE